MPSDRSQHHENVELRSDAIQEVLGKPPRWIVRWGITLLFCIVLALLIGSIFFRYPDVVTSEVTITTQNPPSWVVARSSGKLQELWVTDKQVVHTNDLLAMIDNPASSADVFTMKHRLDSLAPFFYSFDLKQIVILKDSSLHLGELQDGYTNLTKQLKDYARFIELDYYNKKLQSLERELKGQENFYAQSQNQHKLQVKETELAEKQFQREVLLFQEKTISLLDYENAEKGVLIARRALEQSNINLSNIQITIEKLKQSITELKLDYEDKLSNMQLALQNSYEQLKAQISIWEQRYVLSAKIDGVVSFNDVWSVNNQVEANGRVFAIVPENQGKIVGKVKLPAGGAGKVKVGQNVNIKLDGYPYMEYGMIKARVTSISLLPSDKNYMVELELPNGLISFYNRSFDFTGELTGTAEILTDELSVMERFFNPLRYLFKKNVSE